MEVTEVTDPSDLRLADYRDLTDRRLRQLRERSEGFFIAEGAIVLEALAETGWTVRSVLITPARLEILSDVVARFDAPVLVASRQVMDAVGGFPIHRGVLAAAVRPAPRPWIEFIDSARLLLLVEEVNDLENVGSLFRVAAAFGAAAVVLSPNCADPLYRRCIRVSMGHALRVPFAVADDWPAPIAELSRRGWVVAGLSPAAPLGVEQLAGADRVAVVVGAEGPGLRPQSLAACSTRVAIPMAPGVDSLNVAVAAAIAMYEATRRASPGRSGQTAP